MSIFEEPVEHVIQCKCGEEYIGEIDEQWICPSCKRRGCTTDEGEVEE